jgi:hypothetical protein
VASERNNSNSFIMGPTNNYKNGSIITYLN